jgi:hypothetical protein
LLIATRGQLWEYYTRPRSAIPNALQHLRSDAYAPDNRIEDPKRRSKPGITLRVAEIGE